MSTVILQGEPPVEVAVRRSARARRMTLRVSRFDGRVTLTLPCGVAETEAQAFAGERADWIRKHLSERVEETIVAPGGTIPLLGETRRLVRGSGSRVLLSDAEIAVGGSDAQFARKLAAWLKQTARSELAFASDSYAAQLGVTYSKLTMRDTRSRWGSCTSNGGLMYSWRLIMAPAEVLSYVAAHEVAHLVEMNHSRKFWDVVHRLYGDHAEPRRWLRTQGHTLHQYRF